MRRTFGLPPGAGAVPPPQPASDATRPAATISRRRTARAPSGMPRGDARGGCRGARPAPRAAVPFVEQPAPFGLAEAGDLGPPDRRVPQELVVEVGGRRGPDGE